MIFLGFEWNCWRISNPKGVLHALATLLQLKDLLKIVILKNSKYRRTNELMRTKTNCMDDWLTVNEFPESENEKKTHFHFTRIEYSTTTTTTTNAYLPLLYCISKRFEIRYKKALFSVVFDLMFIITVYCKEKT